MSGESTTRARVVSLSPGVYATAPADCPTDRCAPVPISASVPVPAPAPISASASAPISASASAPISVPISVPISAPASASAPRDTPDERLRRHRRLHRAMAAKEQTLLRLTQLIMGEPQRPPAAAEPSGAAVLAELRAENDRLRAADAAHVEERARLLSLVRDLRRELEEAGRALRGQTAALRSVGGVVARSGPHQMIRQRRAEESDGGECSLTTSICKVEDRHRVARRAWAAQEQELKRYAAILEAHVTRMERQLPPERPGCATLFNIALRVLSCEGLLNRRNNGAGLIDPFVVLYGPCGERLLETLPCEDTDCPSFAMEESAATIKAVRNSPWAIIVDVYSRGANNARLFLGRATLPLGPLVAELTATGSCAEETRTLPLFPREREPDAEIVSHAGQLGRVVLRVAAAPVGAGVRRRAVPILSPMCGAVVSRVEANDINHASGVRFVRVVGGRGVLKRDAHVKSHPYVVARRGSEELLRTAPASATTNPQWDCETFAVTELFGAPIVFSVYDYSGDGTIDDDFLGEARLTSEELLSGDEWFELILRPRRNEPLAYIREYHDRLGKLLVQCTIENHSDGGRRAKWSRRQSSPLEVSDRKSRTLPRSAALNSVQASQTAIQPPTNFGNREELVHVIREESKKDTQIESSVKSESVQSQHSPELKADTREPSPLVLVSPASPSEFISSRTAVPNIADPVEAVTALAAETATPTLTTDAIFSSSSGKKENDANTNISKTVNWCSMDPVCLRIYVKEGKDLLDCDQAMFNVLGVTDPRVLVWVGPDHVFTVSEKRDTVNPQWNKEEAEFLVNVQTNHIIRFEVQDVDVAGFDSMGTATVQVSDILERLGEHSLPVVLHGKQYGTLTVVFGLGS